MALAGKAPAGGFVVSLSSDDPAATVPVTVTLPEGASSASFRVATKSVGSTTVAMIMASGGGTGVSAGLTIRPADLFDLTASVPSAKGGATVVGTATLNGIAPPDGASVVLTSDNPSVATVTSPLVVSSGASSKRFNVKTHAVATATTVTTPRPTGESKGASSSRPVPESMVQT